MIKKLDEVCRFYSGTGFPVAYQGKSDGELPFYKVSDIANNVAIGNVYLSLCNNYISRQEASEIRGSIIPKGTIVFAKIGEALKLNRRAITNCDCLIDNNAMGIAPMKELLRTEYFFYFMKQLKMQEHAETTTVPSVRRSKLEQVEIDVPSLDKQEGIEQILNKTSMLIHLRQQQLQKLDDLVKARFVELTGEAKTTPTRMGDVATYLNGYAFKPEQWEKSGLPIIRIQNLNDSTAIYNYYTGTLPETKFVKGVFCSSVIVATRYSSCVCGLHRELRTCGDFYAARLYSTTPARAAPAMTLMGLGFHLRRTKKPARKITRAIRSKLPKSAGRVRWP